MKKCPFCAEAIQDEAIKCRHCGSMLNDAPSSVDAASKPLSAMDSEIKDLVVAKKKIHAIKLVRERQGLGLAEAKAYVERIEADLGLPKDSPKVSTPVGCVVMLLVIVGIALLTGLCGSNSATSTTTTSAPKVSDAECRKTLACWAEKHTADAAVRCRGPVEMLAKNNFEWTDGMLEPKFSHYRWKNQATGEVTYIGDKIKYQNGFGAWIIHTYECDLDASGQKVTDVRASPGQIRQ
jgi:hypothetical protein